VRIFGAAASAWQGPAPAGGRLAAPSDFRRNESRARCCGSWQIAVRPLRNARSIVARVSGPLFGLVPSVVALAAAAADTAASIISALRDEAAARLRRQAGRDMAVIVVNCRPLN